MKRSTIVILIMTVFISFGTQTFSAETEVPKDRGKAVPANALPETLSGMTVKDYFVPADSAPVGKITVLSGHVVVHHKGNNTAYFAEKGDAIYSQDVFYTLKGSRCRIRRGG